MSRLALAAFGVGVSVLGAGLLLVVLGAYYDGPDVPDAEVVWSASVGTGASTVQRTTRPGIHLHVAGDTVLLVGPQGVVALDERDGKSRWRTAIDDFGEQDGVILVAQQDMVVADERVVIVSRPGGLVSLNVSSGRLFWRHETPGATAVRTVLAENVVIAYIVQTDSPQNPGDHGAQIVVLHRLSGEVLRTLPVPYSFSDIVATDGQRLFVAVEAHTTVSDQDGDRREIAETDLVAYDLESGSELWRRQGEGALRPHTSGPHLAASTADTLIGLDPTTGGDLWTFRLHFDGHLSLVRPAPAGAFSVVTFSGTATGMQSGIDVIDAATGEERWNSEIADVSVQAVAAAGPHVALSVATVGAGAGAGVVVLDGETGDERWEQMLLDQTRGGGAFVASSSAGSLFLVDPSGRVQALDPEDGTTLWHIDPNVEVVADDTPAVHDGIVYLAGADGLLRAFDSTSGERAWQERLGTVGYSQPTVEQEGLFAVTGLGSVRAHDPTDGRLLWRSDNRLDAVAQAVRPVVADDTVVAAAGDQVWALDATSGAERWAVGLDASVAGLALASSGTVLIARTDGVMSVHRVSDGQEIWSETVGDAIVARPVVAAGVGVAAVEGGELRAVSITDGGLVWSKDLEVALLPAPLADGDVIYVADGARLLAIHAASGDDVWRHEAEFELEGQVFVVDGRVHVTAGDRHVLVLEAVDGDEIGLLEMNEAIVPAPAAGDGLVFVVTTQGRLYALR